MWMASELPHGRAVAQSSSYTRNPNLRRPETQGGGWLWRLLKWLFWRGVVVGVLVCVVYVVLASRFDLEEVRDIPERSTVFDRDGKPYGRLQGENRLTVPLAEVSDHFKKALLAREDARFYDHWGIDPVGIARAIVKNLVVRGAAQGASTLTQQLARNSLPLGGKNIHRKVLEMFVSFRMERYFTKDQILEMYVNRIYFGGGVWGIETARQLYFGKSARALGLGEAAMLAGIIRGPTRFSPITNLEGAHRERNTVLGRMVGLGMISEEVAEAERVKVLAVASKRRLVGKDDYAMDAILRELSRIIPEDELNDGGMRIFTTIDPQLQDVAQNALDEHLSKIEKGKGYAHPRKADFSPSAREAEIEPQYMQGAVLAIDNRTGGIRCVVGGRDYHDSRFNRALNAQRQVGSTFKSFVYLAAFGRGLHASDLVDDGPIRRGEVRDAPRWSPANSDNTFRGMIPMEDGLINSRNTSTVRVGERATLAEVVKIGSAAGFTMRRQPSVYLGAFEATLKTVTTAYTVFPNQGRIRQPFLVERIEDRRGTVLYRANLPQRAIFQPGACAQVSRVLAKVLERGSAASARSVLGFKRIAAGKTGTTDNYQDAWFVGYTTSLTCGVWVGFDKPQKTVPQGYGSTLALPVWTAVMDAAPLTRYPAGGLPD